jgi:hypothetical protein
MQNGENILSIFSNHAIFRYNLLASDFVLLQEYSGKGIYNAAAISRS